MLRTPFVGSTFPLASIGVSFLVSDFLVRHENKEECDCIISMQVCITELWWEA